jgi:hypothetical protein
MTATGCTAMRHDDGDARHDNGDGRHDDDGSFVRHLNLINAIVSFFNSCFI